MFNIDGVTSLHLIMVKRHIFQSHTTGSTGSYHSGPSRVPQSNDGKFYIIKELTYEVDSWV